MNRYRRSQNQSINTTQMIKVDIPTFTLYGAPFQPHSISDLSTLKIGKIFYISKILR